ncbi:MAG TPA: hypothetical protein VJT74_16410 [Pyrinomonadaceae bacterium]|nr:hypothetical protein [Pyrinomonadaceae bacterium]
MKNRKALWKVLTGLVTLVVFGYVLSTTASAVTTINFSEYPVGTVISTQYSSLGVNFSGSGGTFISEDGANPTAPVLSGNPQFHGSITATFVNPNDPTQTATARNVSFDAGYFDDPASTRVTWFDANGRSLGSQTNSQFGIQRFTIPDTIASFTVEIVSTESAGFAIDNLSFELAATATVQKIQYQSDTGFVDITGTLYVLKGTTVTFKAVPNPSYATWPAGKPTWDGTSGATGSGETNTVTFNTVSKRLNNDLTVTARTTNKDKVTVKVIVYELTGVLTPQDNFTGRSTTRYGLAELVNLSFTAKPAVTAAQAGGLTWKTVNAVGSATTSSNGISIYTAPPEPGTATLKLEVLSGPSKGLGPSYDREIVAPADVETRQTPGTNIGHFQDTCSIAFSLQAFLLPKDVSFDRLGFLEGEAIAVASGYYADLNGEVHQINGPQDVGGCNITTGCKGFEDIAGDTEGRTPPYADGDFLWPIPWQYQVRVDLSPVTFFTANHHQTSDPAGTATIEKARVGPFSKMAPEPTSVVYP